MWQQEGKINNQILGVKGLSNYLTRTLIINFFLSHGNFHFQNEAIKLTYPWALAKGFDTATPVSEFIPKSAITDPNNVKLWLKVDGEMKQDGNTQDMIYKIPHLISFVSRYMTLEEGDLILTGTPEGGSPVKRGQTIICGLGDKMEMTFPVSS